MTFDVKDSTVRWINRQPEAAVEIKCPACKLGQQPRISHFVKPYRAYHPGNEAARPCQSYDRELRHVGDPIGWHKFAWWPVQCRNGYWRWLRWVELHGDGTYSLGNRAH
jgi:hypothetical protein